jgi:hypothetical protein
MLRMDKNITKKDRFDRVNQVMNEVRLFLKLKYDLNVFNKFHFD